MVVNRTVAEEQQTEHLRTLELSFANFHFVFGALELGLATAALLLVVNRMQQFSLSGTLRARVWHQVVHWNDIPL